MINICVCCRCSSAGVGMLLLGLLVAPVFDAVDEQVWTDERLRGVRALGTRFMCTASRRPRRARSVAMT